MSSVQLLLLTPAWFSVAATSVVSQVEVEVSGQEKKNIGEREGGKKNGRKK